ncbi:MAG: hypothetical protein R3E10_06015 [Gemmatimonadota bacterium]
MRPDEGELLALLDGALSPREAERVRAALASDPELADAYEGLCRDARAVTEALLLLDGAKQAGEADVLPLRRKSAPTPRVPWARAAVVVLAAGLAGASALPGSPVRGWLRTGWERVHGTPTSTARAEDAPQATIEPLGVRLAPDLGRLRVTVTGAGPDALVEVIFAGEGLAGAYVAGDARFSTSPGRVDVQAPTGPVRIELPEGATDVELAVDGRLWLRRVGARLEVLGPVIERDDTHIRFGTAPGAEATTPG